jgi:Major Facilitator Superfamily.
MDKAGDSKFFYGWIVLAGCFLLSSVYGFFYNYGVFFDPLQDEFGWGRTLTSTLPGVSTLIYSGAAILMGWLTDKIGTRKVIIGCSILVGAGLA